ncbi:MULTISPECIES: SDR family oxidoreductase [unclassified Brenneria]|uniref:SDR family oxidoreductase n=1 Tax=unclassified Brenneria TaxID=2634434 RepID=UPI0029C5F95A|nr:MULTISPECIES: SDR family oxidoreductase [unclassified Brenneria]MDX5627490.1 SDR family oxidoreductase [Brenneria sp. L3-3Z]MDX5694354.1 SDR family oxidoreductase [Brenneria sp. L4-2C]
MTTLKPRIALVTGASRGIGRAIALALAAQGVTVAAHFRRGRREAAQLVTQIEQGGGRAFAISAALDEADGAFSLIRQLQTELIQRYGEARFDILVNNAGQGGRATIAEITPVQLSALLQVNFISPFFLTQQAIPLLRDGGRIINISSMGTRAAFVDMAAYAPAKAALETLSVLLAGELGKRGITVNAVLPGATATEMNPRASDPQSAAQIARGVALGRVGQPEDIAAVVAFLASEAGGWVTGQRIDASGGQRL